MEQNRPQVDVPKFFKILMIVVLGLPLLLAILFTEKEWYPATYAIHWLSDDDGTFPEKAAILLNFILLLLPMLGILVAAVLIKKAVIKTK